MTSEQGKSSRATFTSRMGAVLTLVGVAVGLGNVWRFPYMVGQFGGAAFVLLYVVVVALVGIPGLMAEFALGRATKRGPVGAFAAAGLPFGREIGWFLFFVVTAATAYYCAVIGWVLYYAFGELVAATGTRFDAAAILPPDSGFAAGSFVRQLVCTGLVVVSCAVVLVKGLRGGIERASVIIMPLLYVILLVLVVRSLSLPGAMAGVEWYILKFRISDINAKVAVAALGQVIFSMSLGGTFMVIYGSYLGPEADLRRNAVMTGIGDTLAGLLAGLAIFPAVFALGLSPDSGPSLLFSTLPKTFAGMPLGWLFGLLFYCGLFGAAWLSAVAAFEVLVAGLTDNTRLPRRRAVWLMCAIVFALSLPPSINNKIFVPWDLTFGSGMQTLGALLAVLTLGWCMHRSVALAQLTGAHAVSPWLIRWIRFGVPAAILTVGVWWFVTSVLKAATGV